MRLVKHTPIAALGLGFLMNLVSCAIPIYDPFSVPRDRQVKNRYYAPTVQNVPLLTNKNDIAVNLTWSGGDQHTAASVQGAYMVTKNIGLIGGYISGKDTREEIMSFNKFEFGGGYAQKISESLQFETYAGVGAGSFDNTHFTGSSTIKNSSFFVQPTIALTDSKGNFKLVFVSKFSSNNFNVTDTTFRTDRESISAEQLQKLHYSSRHLIWEPGIFMRFGWKNLMFQTSYTHVTNLTDDKLFMVKNSVSLGIHVRFNANDLKAREVRKN